MNKCVALVGFSFDPNEKVNEVSMELPENSKVLSVHYRKTDNTNTIYFSYSAPAEAFDEVKRNSYPWKKYAFIVCQCSYSKSNLFNTNYIGDIDIGNDDIGSSIYSVFYK